MNPTGLVDCLSRAKGNGDLVSALEVLFDDIQLDGSAMEFVRVILLFMEENPTLDYGVPGPLVHFVERFYGHGYEEELLASLSRRPISHTVWMLNRVINGTREGDERAKLLNALRVAQQHPSADAQTRNLAARFIQNCAT